jgi:hypothetical protein
MAEQVHFEPPLAAEPELNSVAQVAVRWQPEARYWTVLLDAAAVPQPEELPQSEELELAALAL